MADHTNKNSQNEVFLLEKENLSYAFVKKEIHEEKISQPIFFQFTAPMGLC